MPKRSPAPLIAVLLLILPLLYVGSYLALVRPGITLTYSVREPPHYRWGGRAAEFVFWPLEKLDRKVRPRIWSLHSWEWLDSEPVNYNRHDPQP